MQAEHCTGCSLLVLKIKTKFPLYSPDNHFLRFPDQCWHGKEHRSFCISGILNRVDYININESLLSAKVSPGMFHLFIFKPLSTVCENDYTFHLVSELLATVCVLIRNHWGELIFLQFLFTTSPK